MSAVLRLAGMTSGYGAVAAVRDLDLEVGEGEVVGLLGPNGAGKTTTLLTISGLLQPSRGSIELLGQDLAGRRPHRVARMGVGHVPEDKSLFYQLTVRDNLALGTRTLRRDLDQVTSWFPELARLLNRKAGLLSGGEQQMLALARTLIRRPRILLIDEMSMGLAPIIVERLFGMIGDIQRETGLSVLLVEQHVAMALGACERVYVLNHGQCMFEGAVQVLRKDPALLEAAYLGTSAVGQTA
ncbi:ABC transporter ATP-binding protein [Amycolatopsis sp. K13G38]|uniref:ABC transporter ATP-binding protein n=1 Tax=Amycolatopsis acididurans TaxID=2724524 RepID=A0ABX1JIJ2_9PSEU|nr:ABC transporter ATP-binding protein [Amycolatopsis acididurans]NKQ58057.1 ABC transporter ATP-binding protein [Amycolatopsis acididurans]